MTGIWSMKSHVQNYAWGSTTAIAQLRGEPGDPSRPEAELWMGAHPKAPSEIWTQEGPLPLNEAIVRDPLGMLGPGAQKKFGALPFLLKVLAAEKPLSIQCHPGAEKAKLGFERENQKGIPLTAAHRNYRDASHKPELISAITDFWALKGFRPIADIKSAFSDLGCSSLDGLFEDGSKKSPKAALNGLLCALLLADEAWKVEAIDEVVRTLRVRPSQTLCPEHRWVLKLHQAYPKDVGVLAPLFLNLIHLRPQEALYLQAGELHSYLQGVGIEIMANSDNVLRGGLTQKHIDVQELLEVLHFEPHVPNILRPKPDVSAFTYPTDAAEFTLSVITLGATASFVREPEDQPEILFALRGHGNLTPVSAADEEPLPLRQGQSVFVAATAPAYRLTGEGTFYRARVP